MSLQGFIIRLVERAQSILSTQARSVNFLALRYRDIRDTRKGMLKQSLSRRGDERMRHSCCCCCSCSCPCPRINPVTRAWNFHKKSFRWMPSSRISCRTYIYIYIYIGRKESLLARFCRESIRWNATHRTEHRPRDIDCPINNVTTWRGRRVATTSSDTWFVT